MGRFSLTACSITFAPTAMTGWEVFIYGLAVAAVFWVIAAAIILANRRTKSLVLFSLRALGVGVRISLREAQVTHCEY